MLKLTFDGAVIDESFIDGSVVLGCFFSGNNESTTALSVLAGKSRRENATDDGTLCL